MAGNRQDNNFSEQIAFLESMFGGTVSKAVISSVLESCDGNVHLAADAIMNFSEEMSTQSDEPPKQIDEASNENDRSVTLKSSLNVSAPSFEFLPAQGNQPAASLPNSSSSLGWQSPNTSWHKALVSSESTTNRQQSFGSTAFPSWTGQNESYDKQKPANVGSLSTAEELSISFSQAFRNSGTIPKKPPDSKPKYRIAEKYPDKISKILDLHNKGTRLLVLMRGPAGSGKSYLAKHIVGNTVGPSTTNYERHIFSADSFFIRNGVYRFNRDYLDQAHAMNKKKVFFATNEGVSPIIVDNTNTELWEMEPYIRDGVRNGYVIEFLEPNTTWARNAHQLAHRNIHGVNRDTIQRMLDRYDRNITPEGAMRALKLSYPLNKKPPQLRCIPPIIQENNLETNITVENYDNDSPKFSEDTLKKNEEPLIHYTEDINATNSTNSTNTIAQTENVSDDKSEIESTNTIAQTENVSDDKSEIIINKLIEAQKEIEQYEKIEQEWEKGESWDNTTEASNAVALSTVSSPKPPREVSKIRDDSEKILEPSSICDDWTQISMFMPPWKDVNSTNTTTTENTVVSVTKTDASTGFNITDMDESLHKVVLGTSRNINENTPDTPKKKIPMIVMLDKSTATHENDFLSKKEICKNTERHFRELRKMFKSVPRDVLRDIFESCNFDVNWVVNLVLDGDPESQKGGQNVDISDSEDDEEPVSDCNCLAGYSIVPDVTSTVEKSPAVELEQQPQATTSTQKKTKRENKQSDNSIHLKRQIESNIMISESHYSQHYLNMRKRRENNGDEDSSTSTVSGNTNTVHPSHNPESQGEEGKSDSSKNFDSVGNSTAFPEFMSRTAYKSHMPSFPSEFPGPSTSSFSPYMNGDEDSDTESDSTKSDNLEKTVTINLGQEFISKLDDLFGRTNFQYPANIQPVVNLPMSLLQQINAHWAMSVASQLDDGSLQTETMIKQDEEFARQLAAKEREMSDEGKEPETPSLREIMDMELAYAIYQRSVAEWRNNEPQDLAARLSREKLYNLFPDLSKEVLSEVLMAHDYSFKDTVESLIISTGQSDWLQDEKGVEKFVMQKEMERKEKFVAEQKRNLDATEWPFLSKPDKPITLETVNYYREEAEKSLHCRNQNFEKARQYFAKNIPAAASVYSDIAALHTRRYEQSSCLAAAYLMNYHLKNNPDHDVLDLHYLRVAEALVNLDIFLDQIILSLRTRNIRYKETWIITGKGMHSVGGPRIKPATKKRLQERDIMTKQINGGLIMATLHPTDKMTNELNLEKS